MQIIPAIDIKDGAVVRLKQGDFNTRKKYMHNPAQLLAAYVQQGAQRIHLVDLNAAQNPSDKSQMKLLIDLIRQCPVPVQTGSGIRNENSLTDLLKAGAQKIIIGTLAATNPKTVQNWIQKYGADRFILSLGIYNTQGRYKIALNGWQDIVDTDIENLIQRYTAYPELEYLITDIGRDGMLMGPNTDLYQTLIQKYGIKIQASGGVKDLTDIKPLSCAGCVGVVIGKAFLENKFTVTEALKQCANNSAKERSQK